MKEEKTSFRFSSKQFPNIELPNWMKEPKFFEEDLDF